LAKEIGLGHKPASVPGSEVQKLPARRAWGAKA
jgi:hypothetical protein